MSNSILQDMANIVWAAAPELRVFGVNGPGKNDAGYDLWSELWADIKPIKYGNSISWNSTGDATLARYEVPIDTYHCVLRVKTETVNYNAAATDYYAPCAPPGTAWWELQQLGTTSAQVMTDQDAPVQTMTSCEEFLIFPGSYYVTLRINFSAAPTGDVHEVRTLVYGYNITNDIASRIGSNQAVMIIP